MFGKFLPKRDIFFVFFEKHAAISHEASKHLFSFATIDNHSHEIFQKLKELEHEADTLAHQCIEALHKTFITPIDRMDIYRLITTMDDIVDEIEDIARLFVLYKLKNFDEDAKNLAKVLISSTEEIQAAVKEFRKMKITKTMRTHFFNINHLENEADVILSAAVGRLFDEEKDPKALIKWKEVYEHLEKATDACEDVANILEGIILENE